MVRRVTLVRAVGASLGITLGLAILCVWPVSAAGVEERPTVEVVGFKLREGLEPVALDESCSDKVSKPMLSLVRREGIVGMMECGGWARHQTRVPSGRIIVIVTHQITMPVELPLSSSEIVYVQLDDVWQMYPSDAVVTDEKLYLYPDPSNPTWATMYWVATAGGGRTGGTLFTWGKSSR